MYTFTMPRDHFLKRYEQRDKMQKCMTHDS